MSLFGGPDPFGGGRRAGAGRRRGVARVFILLSVPTSHLQATHASPANQVIAPYGTEALNCSATLGDSIDQEIPIADPTRHSYLERDRYGKERQ